MATDECLDNLYGPSCDRECRKTDNGYCDGHGSCNDGVSGDGTCACDAPWDGNSDCTACARNYYGADCQKCECEHGSTCNDGLEGTGCICPSGTGWIGEKCAICGSHWKGAGCDECGGNWVGADCNECPYPWAGSNCDLCNSPWTGSECNEIRQVVIDGTTWMAANMSGTVENDGSSLTCHADIASDADFVEKYGCFYDFDNASKVFAPVAGIYRQRRNYKIS